MANFSSSMRLLLKRDDMKKECHVGIAERQNAGKKVEVIENSSVYNPPT